MDSIKRDYKEILIAILIMGIISMTIVYANFTRRLQIINMASVNNTNWDIHFENLVQKPNSNSDAAEIISPAVISEGKTIISGLDVNFNKPGDYVTYTFDIVNNGELDAKLYNYVKSTPTCEPSDVICNSIIYSIKYTDGSNIKTSDILKVNERRSVTLTLKLDDSVTSMPGKKIEISNINAVFDYVQN
ncbi:MAG: hypothetical protein IJ105_02440 [Bacilli bacterium]|nr:hypothetical protein [Bacilli bacterium]